MQKNRSLMMMALGLGLLASAVHADNPLIPAEFVITDQVAVPAEKAPPVGVNHFGASGANEYARNNFFINAGNEPIYWRNLHRVVKTDGKSFEIDGGGVSWWDLWGSGFLSGAKVRIYRLVDQNGKPLPLTATGRYVDTSKAHHVAFVGETSILPENSPGFPDGGWVVNKYIEIYPNSSIRDGNLSATDNNDVRNGTTYWYTVVARNAKGEESDLAGEVSVTPQEKSEPGPRILNYSRDREFPQVKTGQDFTFTPTTVGGTGKLTWSLPEEDGKPAELPSGLRLDPATGTVKGKIRNAIEPNTLISLKVTDETGKSDSRRWMLNPADAPAGTQKLLPPTGLTAESGNGFVTIRWQASPSPDVVSYRLKRSTAPLAKQENRVYLLSDAPRIEPFDYIVVERKFVNFDLKYLNNRVRGMGNRPGKTNWYWTGDSRDLQYSLVPHGAPVPPEMTEPGETCMQIRSDVTRRTTIFQNVFIGTNRDKESIWYGQLEPGKKYRFEAWMRQEDLKNNGSVLLTFGVPEKVVYPGLTKDFSVTGQWQKYVFDLVGPPRPDSAWHFGAALSFTGPGKLWIDNVRLFRADSDEALTRPYVPNATVLDELISSEPVGGPKGSHRIWLQGRNITMKSLLSWYGNSRVNVDWSTSVAGCEEMTLPPSLEFCLRTGASPANRVVPWITMQHILHTEEDWRGFVEYLCAPYDPAKDSPEKKPWAYMRYQQRGNGTPWMDEFREFIIEFGNETWHNGVFDDWLGFSTRGSVWQGGKEYGIFSQYLIDQMKKSPYWRPELNKKIRFALNDGYGRYAREGGKLYTYGEEAILRCPDASLLTHANYVGPKWETGDKSRDFFDDHGVQAMMLAYQTRNREEFMGSKKMQQEMAAAGHVYDMAAYESGPSGFSMGNVTPAVSEVQERYGKSLSIAIAAFDGWMDAYQQGWTYQNYYTYAQGRAWNSHTWLSNGFRPSVAWQAMKLRNRFARGDMMAVQSVASPTLQVGKADYPLAGSYAFREGKNWYVFVLSRTLDGSHDGHDFGDGYTDVTLRLPFTGAGKITLHKIAGDPRLSNRDKLNFDIQSKAVAPETLQNGRIKVGAGIAGEKAGLSPGGIYLYEFENVSGTGS